MRQDRKTEDRGQRTEDRWSTTESVCHPPSVFRPPSSVVRSRGFTFVELLATIVLISIVMPVVMRTIGLCTQIAGQSRRQVEAVCLAKTKLTELTAAQDWQNGSNRGDFGTDWPGYEWTMTLATWAEDASVRQLDLTVSWRSVGRQRKITLSTLVYPQEQ